jgi:hypothetical protein
MVNARRLHREFTSHSLSVGQLRSASPQIVAIESDAER